MKLRSSFLRCARFSTVRTWKDSEHSNATLCIAGVLCNVELVSIGRGNPKIDNLHYQPEGLFSTVGIEIGGTKLQLTEGKWYYEVTIEKQTPRTRTQFGWRDTANFRATSRKGVGDDAFSWGVDGSERQCTWHDGKLPNWGERWMTGDVLGCMADLDANKLSFSRNGSISHPMGDAFQGIDIKQGVSPALSAERGSFTCNFGPTNLKHLPHDYLPVHSACPSGVTDVTGSIRFDRGRLSEPEKMQPSCGTKPTGCLNRFDFSKVKNCRRNC